MLTTDARCSSTREGLATQVREVRRTCFVDYFLISIWFSFDMSLMMASPREKYFGDGGLSNVNLLQ